MMIRNALRTSVDSMNPRVSELLFYSLRKVARKLPQGPTDSIISKLFLNLKAIS